MIKKLHKMGNSRGIIISNDVLKIWAEKYNIDLNNLKVTVQMNDDLSLVIKPFIIKRGDKVVNE